MLQRKWINIRILKCWNKKLESSKHFTKRYMEDSGIVHLQCVYAMLLTAIRLFKYFSSVWNLKHIKDVKSYCTSEFQVKEFTVQQQQLKHKHDKYTKIFIFKLY